MSLYPPYVFVLHRSTHNTVRMKQGSPLPVFIFLWVDKDARLIYADSIFPLIGRQQTTIAT